MARPLRIEYSGALYHITLRGNERKEVFKSQRDREKFLSYLGSATERYGAIVHVYCLMDNHYHLLMETPAGNLSQIMHHVQQSVYGRNPGSIFEAQGARPGSSRRERVFEKAECGADRKSGRFGVVLGAKAGTASQAKSVPSVQRNEAEGDWITIWRRSIRYHASLPANQTQGWDGQEVAKNGQPDRENDQYVNCVDLTLYLFSIQARPPVPAELIGKDDDDIAFENRFRFVAGNHRDRLLQYQRTASNTTVTLSYPPAFRDASTRAFTF
jgi:REP element-mobilizing transposase RayT